MGEKSIQGLVLCVVLATGAAWAQAQAQAGYKQGDVVEAQWGGEWKKAKVIAVKPGTPRPFKVHFEGYDASRDNWLTAAELRALGAQPAAPAPAPAASAPASSVTYKAGDVMEARWGSDWKKASVVAVKASSPRPYKVHYEGYDMSNDQWLTAADMRAPGTAPAPVAPAPVAGMKFQEKERVEARYGSDYLKATVLRLKPGTPQPYLVHYEGVEGRDNWLFESDLRPAGDLWIVVEPGADDRSGTFKATQKVQVEEGGNWMLASITQVKAGRYYVERDGVKGGAWMDGSRLRALPDNAAGNALAAQGLVKDVQPDVNYTGNVKVGDTVEVKMNVGFGDRWTKCTVREITGDKYTVHYGGHQSNTREVTKEQFRSLDKEAALARRARFYQEAQPYAAGVAAVVHVYTDKYPRGFGDGSAPGTPEELDKVMQQLAGLDALCKKTPPEVLVDNPAEKDWRSQPRLWADIAANREKIGKQLGQKMLKEATGGKLAFIRNKVGVVEDAPGGGKGIAHYTEPVNTEDIFFNDGKKTLEGVKASLGRFGQAGDTTALLAEYEKAIADAKARFKANLPPASFKTPYQDATIEKAARGYLSRAFAGAVPLKSGVEKNTWQLEKTDSGTTLARLKWANIQWKDPAHDVCCVGAFFYNEEALVKGGFESPGFITSSYGYYFTWSYQRCP